MTTARLRGPAAVAIALAAACTSIQAAAATTTASATTKALPADDLPSTPAPWVPVAYGDAQLSVPATWWVLYSSPPCPTGSPQGEVFVNPSRGVFHCPVETAPGPGTTISFELPRSPRGAVLGTPEIINGIAVYPYPAGPRLSYLVPSLGVEMTVNGPRGTKSSPHAHEITAICCAHRGFGTKCPVVMAFGDVRGPQLRGSIGLARLQDRDRERPRQPMSGSRHSVDSDASISEHRHATIHSRLHVRPNPSLSL